MAVDDYYEVLGVPRTASEGEIKRAYLKLARELHPDANQGDPATEERFKLVNLAYETLRDPERRRQYDMFGAGGPRQAAADPFGFGGGAAGGFGDIFDAFFGGGGGFATTTTGRRGPRRGEDVEAVLELDFARAVFGGEEDINVRLPSTCGTCNGSGARPGTTPVTCSGCGGSGEIRRVRQSILGQMVTASPCPRCGGTGEEITSPCPDCRGDGRRTVEQSFVVDVPAGVDEGSTLRLTGRGAGGVRGGPPGDLYVHLRVRPHPGITRDGTDLRTTVHVSMTQAALGTHVGLETLDGTDELTIPAGTQGGREFRLRGKGVPHLQSRGRGDLLVTIAVDTPTELTKTQEELLRQLAAERGEDVADADAGLLSRIRGAFK
ncbi:molecular chaperone DnaJ [Acidimicrobiaceae bacterium USS-CC1]|uniref:Chaperone protein DnaJ n=1 Tax=Acidiferrimicrobium australe TaxID=2664430 RepID=A0ABW9QZG3_9ACTN|nr:molecular chaperone DnaJ [Acidiferrimicrobium australe]